MSCARFLLTWSSRSDRSGAQHGEHGPVFAGLAEVGRIGRLVLRTNPATPLLELPGERGWILGHLFGNGETAPTTSSLSPREAERVLASQGQALIADYWGSYLAILCPRDGGVPLLIRDPSGMMPCYIMRVADQIHYASDAAVLVDFGLLAPSVDWSMLNTHLLTPELRRRQTCLVGLSELAQGHAALADGRSAQRMVWDPRHHLEPIAGDSVAIAGRLEATILSSTAALGRDHRPILVGASGGLDSSIVCAALAEAGRRFTCFTMATRDPSGDERRYVREVAASYKVDCLDYVYEPERIDPTRSAARHLPRPVGRFFMQEIERCYRDAWAITGAEAILTGNGGDNVFSYLHSAAPVVDHVLSERPGASTWRTMIDLCRITGCDLLTMARGVWRGVRNRHAPFAWAVDTSFLSDKGGSRDLPPVLTPWLDESEAILPGKRAHIAALMRAQNVIEGYERATSLPVIPALLCQPVVELCLSIPSWRWCEGGINRSMARLAFASRLLSSIARRTAKAGPESLSADLFERWLPILREQLLEGLLSQHGVLDRQAVEQALARTATRRGQVFHRLLALAEAEAWSRHWQGGGAH